ncbi:LOW QUALITY PROTEIN: putative o-methyltransferase [Schistosoma mansoni]|uniref:putative o-methyltransferase n=1 Tax=Schistosoma mansoni TaxID=6183 RepID=UPI00022DC43E|nr:LOW QUALITY PROTEIN: putative o-methyltransferase [Schistosoma mansoni]|eukprot:XP_018652509.1 LOW QUALITY PROTEIN: putative o-methyltransferase [Schistosoma mansoni]
MQLLSNLCYGINARKTLDVGKYEVSLYWISLSIAEVLPPDGRVLALDITDEYLKDYCLPAWKMAGVESKIDFRHGPAVETLQNLIDNGESETFDFAMIDADKENYSNYYKLCLKLVRPRGIIAIDNSFLHNNCQSISSS